MNNHHVVNSAARNTFVEAGEKLNQIELSGVQEFSLDNTRIKTYVSEDSIYRHTVVTLEPPAHAGFGSLMGVEAEMDQIFPEGAIFSINTVAGDYSASPYLEISDLKRNVKIQSNVSQITPGSLEIWDFPKNNSQDIPTQIQALESPKVLAAAAHFAVDVTRRAAGIL